MAVPANLDAFIVREDFLAESHHPSAFDERADYSLLDLRDTLEPILRKPDFQRETAAWDPPHIRDFIKSVATGELIPAVIFWSNPKTGDIFVIDGAHRLSAILAWMHDDYGDGDRSQRFFKYRVDSHQSMAADQTRRMVEDAVGPFNEIMASDKGAKSKPGYKEFLAVLRRRTIVAQWVKGDAEKAQQSFFNINLQSVRLDKTELKLIKGRRTPTCIAARALTRGGTGHKYWDGFPDASRIEKHAKLIYKTIFEPPLKRPIKTLDLPFAGMSYGGDGMKVALELIEFAQKDHHKKKVRKSGESESRVTLSYSKRPLTSQ